MAENKLSLKILLDKKEKKVLFAEAGKEFVDFLFLLLSLPVGTIMKLLKCPNVVGSFGNLYKSLESLNEDYVVLANGKNLLLNPDNVVNGVPFLLPENRQCPMPETFYRCSNNRNHNYVTDERNTSCPVCHISMNREMRYIGNVVNGLPENSQCPVRKTFYCCLIYNNHNYVSDNPNTSCPACRSSMGCQLSYIGKMMDTISEKGVVKELVTYVVMDDLTITPMTMISGIALLKKGNIKDFGALEERMVEFGINEALGILRGALQSKTTLTDVFLVKQEH